MRDADVRAAVKQYLAAEHAGDSSTRIVEEMGVWAGTVRIDIAVINGELSGFELKSDRDTLERLPTQADIYSRVFDRVTLVAGSRHAEKASAVVPQWWGLFTATASNVGVVLQQIRPSLLNPSQEPYLVAELLRKDEAVQVLERVGLAQGWRSKRVRLIHERLASELPLSALKDHVRAALKARPDWLGKNGPHQLDVPVHS